MCTTKINSDKLKMKLASLMLSAVTVLGGSISVFAKGGPGECSEGSESGKEAVIQQVDNSGSSNSNEGDTQNTFERDLRAVKLLTSEMNESNFLETAIELRKIFRQGAWESDFIKALERNARNHFYNVCEYLNVQDKPFKVFDSSSFNLERIRVTLGIIVAYIGG